ncbi:uncharacterized protein LOC126552411 [Aphis gossypii]|uniref:uncharacterized protein LOC126552411 n=1 Tax=Aphis gossypii TaxID=80765 RepID=UPI0021592C11|nr:uncharacterized protein LOC126552411 [Aphis gossypii]
MASAALIMSCVYNYARSPHVICSMGDCDTVTTTVIMAIFPRAVAVGCMVSRAAVAYKNATGAVAAYEASAAEYEAHYPVDACGARWRRGFAAALGIACAALIVPVNAYRIHLLYLRYRDGGIVAFHVFMYAQNASMCFAELQFVVYCLQLCRMFCQINGELSALKSETIAVNRYPAVLRCPGPLPAASAAAAATLGRPPLAEDVERLKFRHQFVSDAVAHLNALYGFQLGASLSALFVMSLFDIYAAVSNVFDSSRFHMFFYVWLFQYAFRFTVIVIMTHVTTKQALKSKILITDINSRHADNYAKEELRLFLQELSSRSMEFTTLDMFVINIRLITSHLNEFGFINLR